MKNFWSFLFALLLSIFLFGCAERETTFSISRNGIDFQVDRVEKTISEGNNTYHYAFSGDTSSSNVTITYPDGASYWYSQSGTMGQGGWSEDYVEGTYVSGNILVDIVQEIAPRKAEPGKMIGAIILIALGLTDILFPRILWYLGYGWRYKNAEPSDAALIFSRIGGFAVFVIGIVLLIC